MQIEKKAFRTLYRLIQNNHVDEKEAYDMAEAIFAINYQYVPVPTPITTEDETQTTETVEVKGFAPVNNC